MRVLNYRDFIFPDVLAKRFNHVNCTIPTPQPVRKRWHESLEAGPDGHAGSI